MIDDSVATLRRFNRFFTTRVGVLDDSFLGTGRPLAAARLLFEVGDGPVTVHELRRRLDADSGYVSRLLRLLEDDRLIDLHDDPDDRRRRVVRLTEAGKVEWNELDRRSDEIARRLLTPLDAAQRDRLDDALDTIHRLLRLATIEFSVVEPDSPSAMAAMTSYVAELDHRFPERFDVGTGFETAELDLMRAPAGAFVVATEDGAVIGCGGLRCLDDGTDEIKRMWVDPTARGLGIGRRLLERLEAEAAARSHQTVVLDTHASLDEAISMYTRAGYERIERYNDNPFAQLFFRKRLSGSPSP
jgi:DNA-binding MarR family transcriptional regulator/N-acetylglutamate synthase-like GNAT family acetyltransferase